MPDSVKKNLLGREVKTSSYSAAGLQGTKKTVTNKKGEVVRSENKLSNGSQSSVRKGLMGRKIEKGQTADGSYRKVTSKSGNTREVKNTTKRAQDYEKTRFTPDSVKKKQVLKNNSLVKEKTTAIKDGKKTATDTRKFSYGKGSMTQKQTMKTKSPSGKTTTKRYVDRTELGGKSGKTPVSTSTKTGMGAVKQGVMYRQQKNK
jgi:hypothetical protein